MGQWKLQICFQWQIGFMIQIEKTVISILLPFVRIHIGLSLGASGVEIFGRKIRDYNEV